MSTPAEDTGEEHEMTTQIAEAEIPDAVVVEPTDEQEPTPDDVVEPDAEAEVVQPAEIEAPTGEVMLRGERGVLALRPDQTVLTPAQQAALVAIGIDTVEDKGVIPHVRPFIHMCQVRGLDPWAKEAYLIGRGKNDKRKWTMQTGIDGYRKMAMSTGRFIRVKKVLFTGQDDDDSTWRAVVDDDGDITMKRVWYDQWPTSRKYPGAAKVVIEHYDIAGNVTTTDAIADWAMYAPFNPKWEWRNGQSKKVLDDRGQEILVLNDMWEKGYAHMLSKCAEALAYRKAFPATMSGFYVTEEMARLNTADGDAPEIVQAQRSKRQQAYADAQQRDQIPAGPADPAASWSADGDKIASRATDRARAGEPVSTGEAVPDAVAAMRRTQDMLAEQRAQKAPEQAPERAQDDPGVRAESVPVRAQVSDNQRAQWYRAELEFISSEVLMQPVARLVARVEKRAQRPYVEFTADHLREAVVMLRAAVASRMRTNNDPRALSYAAMEDGVAAPLDVLLGTAGSEPRDPAVPHAFEDQGGGAGLCWCERFSDEMVHAV